MMADAKNSPTLAGYFRQLASAGVTAKGLRIIADMIESLSAGQEAIRQYERERKRKQRANQREVSRTVPDTPHDDGHANRPRYDISATAHRTKFAHNPFGHKAKTVARELQARRLAIQILGDPEPGRSALDKKLSATRAST